jgi:hypothetical protein
MEETASGGEHPMIQIKALAAVTVLAGSAYSATHTVQAGADTQAGDSAQTNAALPVAGRP